MLLSEFILSLLLSMVALDGFFNVIFFLHIHVLNLNKFLLPLCHLKFTTESRVDIATTEDDLAKF